MGGHVLALPVKQDQVCQDIGQAGFGHFKSLNLKICVDLNFKKSPHLCSAQLEPARFSGHLSPTISSSPVRHIPQPTPPSWVRACPTDWASGCRLSQLKCHMTAAETRQNKYKGICQIIFLWFTKELTKHFLSSARFWLHIGSATWLSVVAFYFETASCLACFFPITNQG